MSKCITGKRQFLSQHLAEEALIEHAIRFNHTPGTGAINIYLCDDCGDYHFTSKGLIHPILQEKSDYIKQQQRARSWENRLR